MISAHRREAVYEQLTGFPLQIDVKSHVSRCRLCRTRRALVQSEINYLNLYLVNSDFIAAVENATCTGSRSLTKRRAIRNISWRLARYDVSCQVINNTLIVSGSPIRRVSEESKYHAVERATGVFERCSPVPITMLPKSFEPGLQTASGNPNPKVDRAESHG
jgi:hypothetical protein